MKKSSHHSIKLSIAILIVMGAYFDLRCMNSIFRHIDPRFLEAGKEVAREVDPCFDERKNPFEFINQGYGKLTSQEYSKMLKYSLHELVWTCYGFPRDANPDHLTVLHAIKFNRWQSENDVIKNIIRFCCLRNQFNADLFLNSMGFDAQNFTQKKIQDLAEHAVTTEAQNKFHTNLRKIGMRELYQASGIIYLNLLFSSLPGITTTDQAINGVVICLTLPLFFYGLKDLRDAYNYQDLQKQRETNLKAIVTFMNTLRWVSADQ